MFIYMYIYMYIGHAPPSMHTYIICGFEANGFIAGLRVCVHICLSVCMYVYIYLNIYIPQVRSVSWCWGTRAGPR